MTEHEIDVLALRQGLNLTQQQLADQLGVSFATVNRWEGGAKPQRAAQKKLAALVDAVAEQKRATAEVPSGRRGRRVHGGQAVTTKPMEQMLWDAACSIRGEKDAAKFKNYLLPLLFLKRLSDVFDDEIERLAEGGERAAALQLAEADHELVRFYLPPIARWGVISGREPWPLEDEQPDIGEHLTLAVRAVARQNPDLAGVIDVEDFSAERNGERDINPAKLRGVVEIFSDPRYRLGLADVEPDFLGRCYEYLLRKFAEGSGQSAGEFFTPTNVGFLMAHILRPRPGESCHDYACGSGGLLIKLQLVARELDPLSRMPLKLYGQELQAESFAIAKMNGIIHDMPQMQMARGDSLLNPKWTNADGSLKTFDIVIANPMWNQVIDPTTYDTDAFDRFRKAGGPTTGKADWAWLQHTLACMSDRGRAAVVLDTGAVTRGSGSKNEDRERNIRKWFVDNDLIDGVILLPDNLFYNTTAAGVIIVFNKNKPPARKGKVVLVNASKRFEKGRPKNFLPDEAAKTIALEFLTGGRVESEVEITECKRIAEADYNLSPNQWIAATDDEKGKPLSELIAEFRDLSREAQASELRLLSMLGNID